MIKSNKIFFSYVAAVTVLFGTGTALSGCVDHQQRAVDTMPKLTYSKDTRTGFCFAAAYAGSNAGMLTMVPCSGEVEQLIKANK